MTNVFTIELNIPGKWRDIWLYKARVYLWDRDGVLHYVDVDALLKHIAHNYGAHMALLAHVFIFRNDWKVGEQLRLMLGIPEIESAFSRPFAERDRVSLTIPNSVLMQSNSQPYPGPVLDTCIYANRVYLATVDGLLESYVHPKYADRSYALNVQLDERVSRLAIKYAAINASAEDRGLYFGRVVFDGTYDEQQPGFLPSKFSRIADYSLAVSHAYRNLLNYTGDPVPSLYRARVEDSQAEGMRFEDHNVVGYEDAADIASLTQSALFASDPSIGSRSADEVEFEILGNSDRFLLASLEGKLRVLSLNAAEDKDIELRRSLNYTGAERSHVDTSGLLDTYPINGGFVIEMEDSVRLINRDGSYCLLTGEAAQVRTFTSSVRFKEAVGVIQEEAAYLVGFHTSKGVLF